jgi:hypothetical protein
MSTQYPEFSEGEEVRNQFGDTLTVLFQRGCQVFVMEDTLAHYHPTKLYRAKRLTSEQDWESNIEPESSEEDFGVRQEEFEQLATSNRHETKLAGSTHLDHPA